MDHKCLSCSYVEGFCDGIELAKVWNGGCSKAADNPGNVLLSAWCSATSAIFIALACGGVQSEPL